MNFSVMLVADLLEVTSIASAVALTVTDSVYCASGECDIQRQLAAQQQVDAFILARLKACLSDGNGVDTDRQFRKAIGAFFVARCINASAQELRWWL